MPFIIAFLVKRGMSSRSAGLVGWIITVAGAVALIIGAFFAIKAAVGWYVNERVEEAVSYDRLDATADAANRVMAADRSTLVNEHARTDDFDNSQAVAKEKTNEASRARTSPLDALFNELR